MNLSELMQVFSSPATIHNLEVTDKLIASLITTLLGVGIVFVALTILLLVTSWMHKLIQPKAVHAPLPSTEEKPADDNEGELVAAISAAITMTMESDQSTIIIRNIRRVNDFHPQWSRAGIHSQLNSNL